MYIYIYTHVLYICTLGTQHANQFPCPIGTFGDRIGYNSSMDCLACSGGSYCASAGLTSPTGYCAAGFYCRRSAESPNPDQTTDANVCPQGKIYFKELCQILFWVDIL